MDHCFCGSRELMVSSSERDVRQLEQALEKEKLERSKVWNLQFSSHIEVTKVLQMLSFAGKDGVGRERIKVDR